jgi:iron(III) transport system ATP-binding protein
MSGPVTHREFLGATVRYGVRVGGDEILIDAPFQSGDELHEVGETVGVTLPAQRMLYLPS